MKITAADGAGPHGFGERLPTGRSCGAADDARRPQLTVYFDGSCPLCTKEIFHYRRLDRDGRLRFHDVSSADLTVASDLSRDAAMARFHVRRHDGQLLSGGAAFAELWRQLPGWRWASRTARLPGLGMILEAAYRVFLPVRPWVVRVVSRSSRRTARRCS